MFTIDTLIFIGILLITIAMPCLIFAGWLQNQKRRIHEMRIEAGTIAAKFSRPTSRSFCCKISIYSKVILL